MAHHYNDNGTVYEIGGGKFNDNGTVYEIDHGKYNDNGTVYELPFSSLPSVGTPLNDMTWEEIRAISDAGEASTYFKPGDTKTIIINGTAGATTFSNLSVGVFILGINHNAAVEGANRIHFQIGKIGSKNVCLCDSKYGSQARTAGDFVMNTARNNSVKWLNSNMRKAVLGSNSTPASPTAKTLLSCLPSDLRSVMKSATKYGSDGASTDYLWLPSEFEMHGKKSDATSVSNQAQYQYYKDGNSKVKYKHNSTSTAAVYFTRSDCSDKEIYCAVQTDGSAATRYADFSAGIAPCFCV